MPKVSRQTPEQVHEQAGRIFAPFGERQGRPLGSLATAELEDLASAPGYESAYPQGYRCIVNLLTLRSERFSRAYSTAKSKFDQRAAEDLAKASEAEAARIKAASAADDAADQLAEADQMKPKAQSQPQPKRTPGVRPAVKQPQPQPVSVAVAAEATEATDEADLANADI
jgi:hypothetical protein